jgi:Ca2+-binding RTX toxin-like protein
MFNSLRASRGYGLSFRRSRCRAAELLDRRVMLAAAAALAADPNVPGAEVLTVTGTSAAEVIRITYNVSTNDVDVIVDGTTIFSTPTTRVYRIEASGLGGNDEIRVETKRRASVNGGGGDDTIVTAAGYDTLQGDAGDDVLQGGGGQDFIVGGAGNDTISTGGTAAFLDVDAAIGGDGDDLIVGGSGRDSLEGGAGNDTLRGQGGDDQLHPGDGIDVVDGGSGSDKADYSELANGDPRMVGLRLSLDGIANDGEVGNATGDLRAVEWIIGGDGADSIAGSSNNETIEGVGGNDTMRGLAGNDDLRGGEGTDLIEGGTGDDSLVADTGTDSLFGCAGNDRLTSAVSAANLLVGGAGNDEIFVATNASTVNGGSGDDTVRVTYYLGLPAATLDVSGGGGAGDTLALAYNGNPPGDPYTDVTFDGVANDLLFVGNASNVRPDFEIVEGSPGPDRLDASMLARRIFMDGGPSEDTLIGGSGSDKLRGGWGNDTIIGNAGTDFINGGPGNDFIDSADGAYDLVNGSSGGSDRADRDAGIDDVSNVEVIA